MKQGEQVWLATRGLQVTITDVAEEDDLFRGEDLDGTAFWFYAWEVAS